MINQKFVKSISDKLIDTSCRMWINKNAIDTDATAILTRLGLRIPF